MEINEGVLQIRMPTLQKRPDNFNRAKLATEVAKRMELFFEVAPTVWLGLRRTDPWVESGNPSRGRPRLESSLEFRDRNTQFRSVGYRGEDVSGLADLSHSKCRPAWND